jgi:hypothetical protein
MCYACAQIVTQLLTLLRYGDVFVRVSLCTRFATVFSLSFSNMHNPQHFHFRLGSYMYVCICTFCDYGMCPSFLLTSFHIILNSFSQSPTFISSIPFHEFSHHSQFLFAIPNNSILLAVCVFLG